MGAFNNNFIQNQVNWSEIKPPGILDQRTLFINPQVNAGGNANPITETGATAGFCGIGFNRSLWLADRTMGIYESITYRVVCTNPSANAETPTFSGYSCIAHWSSTLKPSISTSKNFGGDPSDNYIAVCTHVDITVYRMALNQFEVYYEAYNYAVDPAIGTGGTSGHFTMS